MIKFNFQLLCFVVSPIFSGMLTSVVTVTGFWIAFIYKRKEIKYSRLHEERFILLKDLYKGLIHLDIYIREYIKPNNFLSDTQYNFKGLAEMYNAFLKEYLENKVFIPADVAIEVEKFRTYCSEAIDEYYLFEKHKNTNGKQGKPPEQSKIDEMEKRLKNDLPKVLKTIENKFQKIFR